MKVDVNVQPAAFGSESVRRFLRGAVSGEPPEGPVVDACLQSAPRTTFDRTPPLHFPSTIHTDERAQSGFILGRKQDFRATVAVDVGRLWAKRAVPRVAR